MSCIRNASYLPITADFGVVVPAFIRPGDEFISHGILVLYIIEITIITITLPQNYLLICGFSRTALFHGNLCRIAQAHILLYCGGAIARVGLLSYKFKLLQCSGSLSSRSPILVMTLIRYTLFMEFTTFIAAVIIERAFAYFFIADYEQKPRVWIWRGIVSLTMTSSFLLACLNAIPGKALIAAFFCFVTLLLSLFSTACLFQRNYSKLRRLRNEPIGDSINYTLSIKFQLTENIRTMKIVIVIILVVSAQSAIATGLLVMSLTTFADQPNEAHLSFALMDLLIALSTLITALIGSVMLGEWRRIIKRSPWLQLHLCCCSPITPTLNGVPERHESVQDYFNQLRQAWDK